jgi:hypothetical protein
MKYFPNPRNAIGGIPIPFLSNMDDIGHSKWADSRPETRDLPGDLTASQVPIPVDRAGNGVTILGCICLDGSFTKPMVVILRRTIDNNLQLLGVSHFSCHLRHQSNGFIDRILVEEWLEKTFEKAANCNARPQAIPDEQFESLMVALPMMESTSGMPVSATI